MSRSQSAEGVGDGAGRDSGMLESEAVLCRKKVFKPLMLNKCSCLPDSVNTFYIFSDVCFASVFSFST